MLLHAFVAFLLLPGVVAFLVPAAWPWSSGAEWERYSGRVPHWQGRAALWPST